MLENLLKKQIVILMKLSITKQKNVTIKQLKNVKQENIVVIPKEKDALLKELSRLNIIVVDQFVECLLLANV